MSQAFEGISSTLDHFRMRSHRKARAHYLASKNSSKKHVWVGVPIIFITAFVGSGMILDVADIYERLGQLLLGCLSLIAAILSAFQTFFGFSENAAKHKNAGNQYSSIYRRLGILKVQQSKSAVDDTKVVEQMEEIRVLWDAVELEAPEVSDALYDKAKSEQSNDVEGV